MEEFSNFISENPWVVIIVVVALLVVCIILSNMYISAQKARKELAKGVIDYTGALNQMFDQQSVNHPQALSLSSKQYLFEGVYNYGTGQTNIWKLVVEIAKINLNRRLMLDGKIYTNDLPLNLLRRFDEKSYHFYYQRFYEKKCLLAPEEEK